MISESAREMENRARCGYWSEWLKFHYRLVEDDPAADERRRAWVKSADQWDKAIRTRAMSEGEDLS